MTFTATKKKTEQLRGFKHSKPGLLLSVGGSAFGAVSVVNNVRSARKDGDPLMLLNAVAAALALTTSTALVVRELRHVSGH